MPWRADVLLTLVGLCSALPALFSSLCRRSAESGTTRATFVSINLREPVSNGSNLVRRSTRCLALTFLYPSSRIATTSFCVACTTPPLSLPRFQGSCSLSSAATLSIMPAESSGSISSGDFSPALFSARDRLLSGALG